MNYKAIYSDDTMERLMDVLDECGTCTSEIVTCGPRYMLCVQDCRGRDMVITVWENIALRIERYCSCCGHTEEVWIALRTQTADVYERVNKYLAILHGDWIKFWSNDNAEAWHVLSELDMPVLSPELDDEGKPLVHTDKFLRHQIKACVSCM